MKRKVQTSIIRSRVSTSQRAIFAAPLRRAVILQPIESTVDCNANSASAAQCSASTCGLQLQSHSPVHLILNSRAELNSDSRGNFARREGHMPHFASQSSNPSTPVDALRARFHPQTEECRSCVERGNSMFERRKPMRLLVTHRSAFICTTRLLVVASSRAYTMHDAIPFHALTSARNALALDPPFKLARQSHAAVRCSFSLIPDSFLVPPPNTGCS